MEIARLKEMPAGGRLLARRRPEPSPNGFAELNIHYEEQEDILKLAERQFDAADVPTIVRDEYYTLWESYLKTIIKK
jgi:hypothetical protein